MPNLPIVNPYDDWKQNPTPENMGKVLSYLDPAITTEVARYGGGGVLKSKARVLAVQAVKSYDPRAHAHLRSWVVTNLQPLNRYKASLTPLRMPEVASRKAAELHRLEKEHEAETGRVLDDAELADRVGVPVRNVAKLRALRRAVVSEGTLAQQESGDESTSSSPAVDSATSMDYAASEVYKELDDQQRVIFDSVIGGDTDKLTIAKRLGVSPAYVSQQAASIANRIQQAHGLLH